MLICIGDGIRDSLFIVTDFVNHSSFDGVLMDVAEQGDEV